MKFGKTQKSQKEIKVKVICFKKKENWKMLFYKIILRKKIELAKLENRFHDMQAFCKELSMTFNLDSKNGKATFDSVYKKNELKGTFEKEFEFGLINVEIKKEKENLIKEIEFLERAVEQQKTVYG